jgi:hypothetical protein
MAQSDLDSMVVVKTDAPVTAEDNLVGYGESANDIENAAAAAAAGVKSAAFINYDVALDAYAARADVEDLAHKNARDMPTDFADASFMRTVDGATGSGSAA